MSPSFSLVSLFWCRVKLWHDVGIDPGSGAKRLLAWGVQAGSVTEGSNFTYLYKREKNRKKKIGNTKLLIATIIEESSTL